MRFMYETENNSVEFCNENGSNYLPISEISESDKSKIEALLSELAEYFPKPKIKEISTVNATVPNAGINYMAVNITDENGNMLVFNYIDFDDEKQQITQDFINVFPTFKTIVVAQMSPAKFLVDGVESNFEDYDELQQETINAMGIMLTRLINS